MVHLFILVFFMLIKFLCNHYPLSEFLRVSSAGNIETARLDAVFAAGSSVERYDCVHGMV